MPEETGQPGDQPVPSSRGAGRAKSKSSRKKRATRRNLRYWMVVTSLDNYRRTQERGFTIQGFKTRYRKRVEAMKAGDRLLFYVTGRMAFAATCTLTSGVLEDHAPVWRSVHREEDYPWRVRIHPDAVLDEHEWLPAKELAYRLEYVRKWPPEHWTLAFQGPLHQLPQRDFKLIEDEMRRLERSRPAAS